VPWRRRLIRSARSQADDTFLLAESAEARMVTAAGDASGLETGGILVGVLIEGRPCAAYALEIPSAHPSRNRYHLPAGVTCRLVDCARRVDSRLGYIGEWHVHPADVPASAIDAATMLRLANRLMSDDVQPVLVVVRQVSPTSYSIDAWGWGRHGPRDLKVLRTGDLPASNPT
jgi:Prokaryotic homologs of the JAB domain